ncbi:MAG: DNA repair protein RadC [Cyclobacteriaceae bacterium]|nr:DNA repair protein RadC [Cyclobacteriaceae bacterium]
MEQNKTSIKEWAEEDRPREKLLLKGKSVLSEAELIGILIGSGTRTLTAVDLAKQILHSVDNNLNLLAKLSVNNLKKFKGIGEAKAINIISALELGRRRKESDQPKIIKITSSKSVYDIMTPYLQDVPHEEFWILLLNRANQLLKPVAISQGGVSGTVADPKIIFKVALESLASSIILVHNHPSGNLKPSQTDLNLTKKLKEAGRILEIPVLDHLIYTDSSYFSMADEGVF